MKVEPYLFLEGCCEEALTFYKTALGAEVTAMMRYGEGPENHMGAPKDKIMHASFKIGDTVVMASDGMCSGKAALNGFALSLAAAEPAEAERLFGLLAEGGTVRQPMVETFFAPRFGMVADKFGVTWMVLAGV